MCLHMYIYVCCVVWNLVSTQESKCGVCFSEFDTFCLTYRFPVLSIFLQMSQLFCDCEFHCPHSDLFLALPLSFPSSLRAKTLLDASDYMLFQNQSAISPGFFLTSSLPSLNMAFFLVAPSLGLHVCFQASSLNTASISHERLSDTSLFLREKKTLLESCPSGQQPAPD